MIIFRKLYQSEDEIKAYHAMRCELYIKDLNHAQHFEEDLYEEMLLILKGECFYKNEISWTVFVAENDEGKLVGFIEISLYPQLDFCNSKPVGYIESWFADRRLRHQGIGRGLVKQAEEWLKSNNVLELASDVEVWNELSHKAHKAVGFQESHEDEGCIFYKKSID